MSANDPFHHVRDAHFLELPFGEHLDLPKVQVLEPGTESWLNDFGLLHDGTFLFSKFMILQAVAMVLTVLIFWGLARRVKGGKPAKGRFWNFWEAIVIYLRDNVVRPSIGTGHHHDDHGDHGHGDHATGVADGDDHGHEDPSRQVYGQHAHEDHHADSDHTPGLGGRYEGMEVPVVATIGGSEAVVATDGHPADQYLPFVLTCFFYILFCNLLGAIPTLGTATGSISVTLPLAIFVLGFVIYCGSKVSGPLGFWASLAPGLDLPGPAKLIIGGIIWVIEFVGLFIKHMVLAIRLFANMFAGHTVLGVTLGFIMMAAAQPSWIWGTVTAGSVFGQLFVGFLELFVAFLQAYVFSFLTSLFISAAVNPH